jgi:nucleotide-binding universal stress UspA family protein
MKKILVRYDFSEVANHALKFAADLSRRNNECGVTVINVIEQPSPDSIKTMGIKDYDPMENLYMKKLISTIKGKMQDLMNNQNYKDIKLEYKIVLGNPFNEISEEIQTQGTELVVMGTSGASGSKEFLVGSNAERMVRYSKCPVITVSEPHDADKIDKIVFASNFSELNEEFVNHVKRLQKSFDAKLHIVKINTPSSFTSTRFDTAQFETFAQENDLSNYEFEIYNHSNEEDGIIEYAEDINADMIALGTGQRRGLGHFFSGSIAEDVVNHAKIPVWTFGLDTK